VVHQITEVRLLIGLEVPSKYDLVASRKKNIRQEAVFILPLVPQAAWVSTLKIASTLCLGGFETRPYMARARA